MWPRFVLQEFKIFLLDIILMVTFLIKCSNPLKVSLNLKSVSFFQRKAVCSRSARFLFSPLMLVLSKCPTPLRWTLPLCCSSLPLRSATPSQGSATTGPQFLRTQTAPFHQSEAKAIPELNKPSTGKNTQPAAPHVDLKSLKLTRPNNEDGVACVKSVKQSILLLVTSASFPPPPAVLPSGSGLDGELFGMGLWSLGLGAVGAALAGIFLANTDLCLPKVAKAPLEYLEDADLRSTTDGGPLLLTAMTRFSHGCI